jgi:hypothetical protein
MATQKLDRLKLRGQKAIYTQTLQFPRAFYLGDRYNRKFGLTIDNVRGAGWYVETAVSTATKNATCEEALAILKAGASGNSRQQLQQQGVKRFKLGNLEEEYSGAGASEKLLSLEAKQYLSKYVAGVVPIC